MCVLHFFSCSIWARLGEIQRGFVHLCPYTCREVLFDRQYHKKKVKDFLRTAWWLIGALLCHSQTLQTVSLPSARCMLGQHHCQPDQEWEGLLRGSANETFPSSFSILYVITPSTQPTLMFFLLLLLRKLQKSLCLNIIDFSHHFSLMCFCNILNKNHTRTNHTKEKQVSRSWEYIKTINLLCCSRPRILLLHKPKTTVVACGNHVILNYKINPDLK